MRTRRLWLAGGVLVVLLGAIGLVVAALPDSPAAAPPPSPGQVTVADAYMRAPLKGSTQAVAYFTVYNTTARPDRIIGVLTGAGQSAMLHSGHMTRMAHGAVVPAHGKLVLHTGGPHVMIEHVFRGVKAGQDVNIEVDFARAGAIDVVAKVIPYGAAPPGSGGNHS